MVAALLAIRQPCCHVAGNTTIESWLPLLTYPRGATVDESSVKAMHTLTWLFASSGLKAAFAGVAALPAKRQPFNPGHAPTHKLWAPYPRAVVDTPQGDNFNRRASQSSLGGVIGHDPGGRTRCAPIESVAGNPARHCHIAGNHEQKHVDGGT